MINAYLNASAEKSCERRWRTPSFSSAEGDMCESDFSLEINASNENEACC